MQCIITWSEGEEVHYLFVDEGEVDKVLEKVLEEDKDYIVAYLPH